MEFMANGRLSQSPRHSRGLTVLELCAFVSVVAVLLGGMVSLARHVRSREAESLTRERIELLSRLLRSISNEDEVSSRAMPKSINESGLRDWAARNSQRLLEALRQNDSTLRPETLLDAWGTPIALVTKEGRHLGTAPDESPFLVSAGPDRRFLSLGDNLYSYDLIAGSVTTNPFINPAETGPAGTER